MTQRRRSPLVVSAALLSLAGLLFHNWWNLPGLSVLSLENTAPVLVLLLILGWWWLDPRSRYPLSLLLVWASVHLMGGGLISILPFDFVPFFPSQSLRFYLSHVTYSLAQLPLILLTVRALRAGAGRVPGEVERSS